MFLLNKLFISIKKELKEKHDWVQIKEESMENQVQK